MKKIVLLVIIAVIVPFLVAGCTEPSVPPATRYPRIVFDFLEGENSTTTLIHISGVELTRYSNITLYIDDELAAAKNNSFSLDYRLEKEEFNLSAFADREEAIFYYEAGIRVVDMDEIVFEITDPEGDIDSVRRVDLPYVQRMSRVEEEEGE